MARWFAGSAAPPHGASLPPQRTLARHVASHSAAASNGDGRRTRPTPAGPRMRVDSSPNQNRRALFPHTPCPDSPPAGASAKLAMVERGVVLGAQAARCGQTNRGFCSVWRGALSPCVGACLPFALNAMGPFLRRASTTTHFLRNDDPATLLVKDDKEASLAATKGAWRRAETKFGNGGAGDRCAP